MVEAQGDGLGREDLLARDGADAGAGGHPGEGNLGVAGEGGAAAARHGGGREGHVGVRVAAEDGERRREEAQRQGEMSERRPHLSTRTLTTAITRYRCPTSRLVSCSHSSLKLATWAGLKPPVST